MHWYKVSIEIESCSDKADSCEITCDLIDESVALSTYFVTLEDAVEARDKLLDYYEGVLR